MSINPKEDGISHINVYSKGETDPGKMLSNFYKFPIVTEDGEFLSVEGYWYWMSISDDEPRKEVLRKLYGFRAKEIGKEILAVTNGGKNSRFDPNFERKILKAIWYKFRRNTHMLKPEYRDLPIEHYYNFGGKVVDAKHKYVWMVDGISKMRDALFAKMDESK